MSPRDEQDWLADRMQSRRGRLRAVAYRMLGSLTEADEALQETGSDPAGPAPKLLYAEYAAISCRQAEPERADMGLVDGDPSKHIGDLRHRVRVMFNGKLMNADELREAAGFTGRSH